MVQHPLPCRPDIPLLEPCPERVDLMRERRHEAFGHRRVGSKRREQLALGIGANKRGDRSYCIALISAGEQRRFGEQVAPAAPYA